MILYFSGTGNSRFVAKEIGKQLSDEVKSLSECMRTKKAQHFTSEKPYIIVSPIYVSRMPLEVEEYLKMCTFSGNQDVWFIMTCGGGMGGTADYCRKIAEEKGLTCHGTGCIIMPNNYVALSNVITPEEAREKALEVLPVIKAIALQISRGEELQVEPELTKMPRVSAFADFFHWLLFRDKAFQVNDSCVSCGKCEALCPLCNIRLVDGRPKWNGKCMHCMACISACPVKAIDYGKKTQSRNRYYLEVSDC